MFISAPAEQPAREPWVAASGDGGGQQGAVVHQSEAGQAEALRGEQQGGGQEPDGRHQSRAGHTPQTHARRTQYTQVTS